MKELETAILQAQLAALAGSLLALGAMFWALYFVIKAAIRDGIRESGLVDRQRPPLPTPAIGPDTMPMPDMRAER